MMDGQISIFDWMPEAVPAVAFPNINDITEETAVRMVGNEIGVEFVYNELFHHWEAKVGKMKLDLEYSRFNLDNNHDLFLGAGYMFGSGGGGRPCDSIEDAVKYFRKKIGERNGRHN